MASNLGTPTSAQGNSATASVAHTVASGSNRVSYICVFVNGGVGITSMSNFGGVAPVLVGSFNDAIYVYRVVNPATGATTAQANLPSAVFWSIHVISAQDVDQADPDDAPQTATEIETTSVSSPSITSATNDLVLGFGLMVYPDIAAFAGSTLSTEQESIDGSVVSTAVVYEAGAATVVVGVSSSTVSFGDNLIIAFNIRNAVGGGGTVNTQTASDAVAITDGLLASILRGRLTADTIVTVDGVDLYYLRMRELLSNIVITEGPTDRFITSNVEATSEVTLTDELVAWFQRTRLSTDSITVVDELIVSAIGYLIYTSVLSSNVSVADESLDTVQFYRLMESSLVTSDQILRALLIARDLLDGLTVDDSSLTAMQRFILLTDAISLEDSLTALYIPETGPTVDDPIIRIGFDQPEIALGGYGLN